MLDHESKKYIHTYIDMGTYMHSYTHTYKNISHAAKEPKRINPERNPLHCQ